MDAKSKRKRNLQVLEAENSCCIAIPSNLTAHTLHGVDRNTSVDPPVTAIKFNAVDSLATCLGRLTK